LTEVKIGYLNEFCGIAILLMRITSGV